MDGRQAEALDPSAVPPALREVAWAVTAWRPPEGVEIVAKYNPACIEDGWPEVIVHLRSPDWPGGSWGSNFGPYHVAADVATELDFGAGQVRDRVAELIAQARADLALRVCEGVGDDELARLAEGGGVRGLLAELGREMR